MTIISRPQGQGKRQRETANRQALRLQEPPDVDIIRLGALEVTVERESDCMTFRLDRSQVTPFSLLAGGLLSITMSSWFPDEANEKGQLEWCAQTSRL